MPPWPIDAAATTPHPSSPSGERSSRTAHLLVHGEPLDAAQRARRPGDGRADHPGCWSVRQILHDPADAHDWRILALVDLAASDEARRAVVHITDVGCG
ncbi:MAG: DUF3516 domain-containing protein [Acidimicrobiia bacterium]|nr:DUF3516 domain-containing protein [Acidimicrobiia bacterium]